jgi:hypothetical protein
MLSGSKALHFAWLVNFIHPAGVNNSAGLFGFALSRTATEPSGSCATSTQVPPSQYPLVRHCAQWSSRRSIPLLLCNPLFTDASNLSDEGDRLFGSEGLRAQMIKGEPVAVYVFFAFHEKIACHIFHVDNVFEGSRKS